MNIKLAILLLGAGWYWRLWNVKSESVNLRFFSPAEFGIWWPMMSADLLLKLDEFRYQLGAGYTVMISPAIGTLGRPGSGESQHNNLLWGEVRAADVMPLFNGQALNATQRRRAYRIAKAVGFTGIGVYPDWKPYPGMHLDVRKDRQAGNPARWSRFAASGREDMPIEKAFV